jgi:hypothetical protein
VLRKLLRIVSDWLRWIIRSGSNFMQIGWERFRQLGHNNESESRGLRLLRDWLSSEQRLQYDAHRYFEVIGSHSGRRYRIRHGTSTNIYELDEQGRPKAGWCFVPRDNLVAGDVMLAQKIALETDESSALAVARRFASIWAA